MLTKEIIDNVNQSFNSVIETFNDSVHNKITFMMDLNICDTRNIFINVWHTYPITYDFKCNYKETCEKLFECDILKPIGVYISNDSKLASMFVGNEIIIGFHYEGIYVLVKDETVNIDFIKDYLVIDSMKDSPHVYWVTCGQSGFDTVRLDIKDEKFNLYTHYNDDLDYDKVESFIKSDESGIIILYGDPGTGKIINF